MEAVQGAFESVIKLVYKYGVMLQAILILVQAEIFWQMEPRYTHY